MPFNYDNYAKRFEENPAIFFLSIFVCFWDCIKVRSSNYSIEVFTWWSKASLQSKMFSFSEFMPRKRDSNWTFDFRMFWKWNDSDVFLSSFTLQERGSPWKWGLQIPLNFYYVVDIIMEVWNLKFFFSKSSTFGDMALQNLSLSSQKLSKNIKMTFVIHIFPRKMWILFCFRFIMII